jgi:hypothetical protein
MKAVELVYKGFRFAVPAETEAFWPYYGILFVGEYDPLLKSLRRGDISFRCWSKYRDLHTPSIQNSRAYHSCRARSREFQLSKV